MQLSDETGQLGLSFFLFLVLIGLIAGGLYMIDQLGLFNVRERIYQRLEPIPVVGEYVAPSPISEEAYETQELRELKQNLKERRAKLEEKRKTIEQREQNLMDRQEQLDRKEDAILQREKALAERRSRFDDEESRIQYLSKLYSNMPPNASAARLQSIQDDQVVISILREMPNDVSSIVLSNIPNERAAVLTRKMAHSP